MPYIGIGSYAYRYAIGFKNSNQSSYMSIFDFLSEAHRLNFKSVQLCENLNYKNYSKEKLILLRKKAKELDLIIELGLNGLSTDNILRHLDIANLLSSHFIRVVLSNKGKYPEDKPNELMVKSINILKKILPRCRDQNIFIGIENHYDLISQKLVELVKEINDEHIGLILDTTNHLAFVERPEETLKLFKPYLLSIHLKDFFCYKIEAGYLICGRELGRGQLKTEKILNSALESKKLLSIIIEMTIRKESRESVKEILDWERGVIERSVNYFWNIFNKIKQNELIGDN